MDKSLQQQPTRFFLTVVCLLPIVLFSISLADLQFAPFADLPAHLARAKIIGIKLFGASENTLSTAFSFQLAFTPYILGDLVLAAMVHFLGWQLASSVWTVTVFLLIPIATYAAIAVHNGTYEQRIFGLILATYSSTTFFFLMGFHQFQIGLALGLFAYACCIKILGGNSSASFLMAYCAVVTCLYLTHLATFVFSGFVVLLLGFSYSMKWVRSKLKTLASAWGIFAVMTSVHLMTPQSVEAPKSWGGIAKKLERLGSVTVRYEIWLEVAITLSLVAVIGLVFFTKIHKISQRVRLDLTIVVLLVLVYFALPRATTTGFDIDNRALAFALTLGVVPVSLVLSGRAQAATILLTAAICSTSLFVVSQRLHKNDMRMAPIVALLKDVKPNTVVLPVITQPHGLRGETLFHPADLVTLVSDAFTPDIFSKSNLNPQWYFDYKQPFPHLGMQWYAKNTGPDWTTTSTKYSYLLIQKPYDPSRFPDEFKVVADRKDWALLERNP